MERVQAEELLSPLVAVEEAEEVKVEVLVWEVMVEADREMEPEREMEEQEEAVMPLETVRRKALEIKRLAQVLRPETQRPQQEVMEKVVVPVKVREKVSVLQTEAEEPVMVSVMVMEAEKEEVTPALREHQPAGVLAVCLEARQLQEVTFQVLLFPTEAEEEAEVVAEVVPESDSVLPWDLVAVMEEAVEKVLVELALRVRLLEWEVEI